MLWYIIGGLGAFLAYKERAKLSVFFGPPKPTEETQGEIKTPFDKMFKKKAEEYGVDYRVVRAIALTEHGGSLTLESARMVNLNRDGSQDFGVMQINSRMAQRLGVSEADLFDAETNIDTGVKILASLYGELDDPSLENIFSAYNAGSPAVNRQGIINPKYVERALDNYNRLG